MVRNATRHVVQIPRRARLGSVVEYNQQGCYNLTPDAGFLATSGPMSMNQRGARRSWKSKLGTVAAVAAYTLSLAAGMPNVLSGVPSPSASESALAIPTVQPTAAEAPMQLNPSLEHVLPGGITVYGSPTVANRLASVADEFPEIWNDQGTTVDIPEDQWMPINLKSDAELKPARVYPVGPRERAVIDATFDKMHQDGKMTWTDQPTPFSFPVFVVWRDTANGPKGRVVVDIRGLNKVTDSDTYPMPLQTDITSAMAGYSYISTVDAVGWFHQLAIATQHVTLVEMSDSFKQRLKAAYAADKHWKKVLDVITPPANRRPDPEPLEGENTEGTVRDDPQPRGIRFKLRDELIYYTSGEGRERLCIPASMEQDVFRIAHDLSSHGGFHRTYDRLVNSVYVRQLTKRLRTYIEHCPECQLNQTKRHSPYGSLQPIVTPSIPFHTLAMDFILALPPMGPDELDCALTVTCKFTKKVMAIAGKSTWGAEEWANTLITALMARDWGIPRSVISDRDRKFMSLFWRTIFQKLGIELLTSTAYHPQTDGQSERTNQTLEIALRFWLSNPNNTDWVGVLPYLTATNNNSANASTGMAPNELSYGFRVNDTLGQLEDLPAEDYDRLRQVKRESAEEAMAFANVMHKVRYDASHTSVEFKVGGYAYLTLHAGYTIPGLRNRKLSQQRAGPFKITEKVGTLAYRLELPPVMGIHPVISIAQLEPSPPPDSDPYHRPRPTNPPPVATEDDDPTNPARPYEVETLLDRKITPNGRVSYLVKWKDYGPQYNVWYPLHALAKSQDLVDDYEAKHPREPARRHVARPAERLAIQPAKRLAIQPAARRGRPRKALPTATIQPSTSATIPPTSMTTSATIPPIDTSATTPPISTTVRRRGRPVRLLEAPPSKELVRRSG